MRRAASPRPARPPGPAPDGPAPDGPRGLDAHLADAVRLNRARRAGYVARGGLRAALLSRALVGAERALRPVARWLDRRAARFWAAGVPILAAELSDVAAAPAPDRPVGAARSGRSAPPRSGRAARGRRRAGRRLDLRPARRALRAGRLRACAGEIASALGALGGAAPVARHVLESAGLMALRGEAYARATGGATAPLTRDLVRGHLALVPVARLLDWAAAPLWARGVGLFANDLPAVPFAEEVGAAPPRPAPRSRAHV